MVNYVHHVPGRLRIQTQQLKRDEAKAQAVERYLQSIDGITSARVNALTGSITVNYQKDVVSAETIFGALALRGYHRPDVVRSSDARLNDWATKVGSAAGKAIFGLALEKAVEHSAMALIGALL